VLPQLRELEQRYAGGEIAVVGVHSGKFIAERETGRIGEAAARLGVQHPVVNDRHFRVWRSYAVRAWPTLVVIDPSGYVVGMHAGEFTAAAMVTFLDGLIAGARDDGTLRPHPRPHALAPDEPAGSSAALRYPGKVAVDPADPRRVAVADTGHYRVLVGTMDAGARRLRVERVLGDGVPGRRDGALPRFAAPQGLAFDGDALYVADTGNHLVRAASLATGEVRTVAGTGARGRTRASVRTRADRDDGALASPWVVAVNGGTLYVVMAGTHQLWAVDLESGRGQPFAGGGGEDLRDGPRLEALLAQPMGLCHARGRLYFVDAESSAVRWAAVDAVGAVHTVAGTGLFDFGHQDGVGDEARLQHPQGIAAHEDGRLLVADSYNDALRWVDPDTRAVTTWRRGLHEPGGVARTAGRALVADTNAHRILVLDEGGEEWALAVELPARFPVESPAAPLH
jgi:hypothetical protein